MKRKRFSTEQIVTVLKQHEMGMPIQDLIRQVGVTEQSLRLRARLRLTGGSGNMAVWRATRSAS